MKKIKHLIDSFENAHITLIALFGLTIPFSRVLNVNSVFLASILLLSIIIKYKNRNKPIVIKRDYSLWSMVAFYLIIVASLLYTEAIETGLKMTSRLIPILFFAISLILVEEISRNSLRFIIKYFAVGSILAIVYCLFVGILTYNDNPLALTEGFTYFSQPLDLHPSYFGVFAIFSFSILTSLYKVDSLNKKIGVGVIWVLLLIFLIFLRSRAPILIFFCITFLILFKNFKGTVTIVALIILILTMTLNYDEILTIVSNGRDIGLSIDERINIWTNSLQVIKDNFIVGVGIGDFQGVLDKQYFLSGFEKGIDHRYNNHNQYLQTLLSNGFIGLLSLLLIILLIFIKALKFKLNLGYHFLLCILFLMLFESMLILQHGIYFFAFFSSIILKLDSKTYETI